MLIKPFSLQTDTQTNHRISEEELKQAYVEFAAQLNPLSQNQYLHTLLSQNEALFYRLVQQHLTEMLPVLYTPTVAKVVQNFNVTRDSTRGLYISWEDRDRLEELLEPYPSGSVSIAILTDGERILGLGDQGIGGIEICVAKAMMYVLCAHIPPYQILPIYLDVGTNNQALLDDADYRGLKRNRLTGKPYDNFVDRVVKALHHKFPEIYFHWEDIERDNAKRILTRYRSTYRMFNDDMQGTGVVTLASALTATQITQIPLNEQRIIIFGGGAAGLGIADQLCDAMQRMGLSSSKARERIWLMGRYGLLFLDSKNLTPLQQPYARPVEERCHYEYTQVDLYTTVKHVRPTFLIGCSGQSGAFTESVVSEMARHVQRPIIFPLSNPTECCEANPSDILRWTQYRALIATGTPFPKVINNKGIFSISQCNNALAFPGIGLGIVARKAQLLTDDILWEASLALCNATIRSKKAIHLLPEIKQIETVSRTIALHIYQTTGISSQMNDHAGNLQIPQSICWRLLEQSDKDKV